MSALKPRRRAAKEAAAGRDVAETPARPRLARGIDDSLGFLICDTARFVKRTLYARLARYGIPGASWFPLRILWRSDGLTQRELSETLGLMEPSVLATVRSMERLGLVIRVRDGVDQRKVRAYLTPRAYELETDLMALAEEVNATMVGALSRADLAATMEGLRTIRRQLASSRRVGLDAKPDASRQRRTPEGAAPIGSRSVPFEGRPSRRRAPLGEVARSQVAPASKPRVMRRQKTV